MKNFAEKKISITKFVFNYLYTYITNLLIPVISLMYLKNLEYSFNLYFAIELDYPFFLK